MVRRYTISHRIGTGLSHLHPPSSSKVISTFLFIMLRSEVVALFSVHICSTLSIKLSYVMNSLVQWKVEIVKLKHSRLNGHKNVIRGWSVFLSYGRPALGFWLRCEATPVAFMRATTPGRLPPHRHARAVHRLNQLQEKQEVEENRTERSHKHVLCLASSRGTQKQPMIKLIIELVTNRNIIILYCTRLACEDAPLYGLRVRHTRI